MFLISRLASVNRYFLFFIFLTNILLLYFYSQYNKKNSLDDIFTKVVSNINITQYDLVDNSTKQSTQKTMKYILLWTTPQNVPFVYMGEGQKGFIDRKCPHTNCIVTGKSTLLDDYTKFDVIAFLGPQMRYVPSDKLPKRRSPHQKFVFTSIESADYYPICSNRLDGFFNWTWTFRLDSEAKWGYIVVRDSNGTVIGPKKEMHWMNFEDMDPVSEEFKDKLKSKSKAVAWFVSNCFTRSGRERFVRNLEKELKQYHLDIDIYGKCGPLNCPRGENEYKCTDMLEKDYYFYLSFENSFDEDYVTEKLVTALKHDTIPVVYGGANYTRFMPKGIYLDARELGEKKLAKRIKELIESPSEYAEYFRWKKYYSYHRRQESVETNDYCKFCSILNEENTVKKITIYKNFRQWWDPPNRC